MTALINETKYSLEQTLELLQKKIENSIIEERSVGVSIETDFFTCLHKLYIEDYWVTDTQIYLLFDNFELTINIEDVVSIEYEDATEEYFKITHISNSVIYLFV